MSAPTYSRAIRVTGLSLILLFIVTALLLPSSTPALNVGWLRTASSGANTRPVVSDPRCAAFPDTGDVAIAVKTGSTEAVEKVPILMLTSLACAKNVMIFSDLEQQIAGYQVHDALKSIPETAMDGNPDFDFYRNLTRAQKYGQLEAMFKQVHDPRITNDLAAWTLDKYKFLHILEDLYAAHPDRGWYLLIDADTYVVWPNLVTWIQKLPNPFSNAMYLGSPAFVGEFHFAHGGSGILISHKAMYDFAVTNAGTAARWDKPMHDECCGDFVVGKVLNESGNTLQESWPTMNGERPVTLPFGPTHWCQPVVTMHHVSPAEMSQIGHFEKSRTAAQSPLTFAELFDGFTRHVVPEHLEQWDSNSKDESLPTDSFLACQSACEADDQCFQFAYDGRECMLGHSIHLGQVKTTDDKLSWKSGWLTDRIQRWVESQSPCEPKFPWT